MNQVSLLNGLKDCLGDGDLTLGVFCTNCNAQFELARDAAAMAMVTRASFLEFLRYVQNSKCPVCNKRESK